MKYLASQSFQGIGETLARRIVDKLGAEALERIRADPGCLDGIRGLRAEVAAELAERVALELGSHQAHAFLRGQGLGPWQAAAVVQKLGVHAEELVRSDPYRLASLVSGIGFGTADRVARALGLELDDPRRTRAGLLHALRDAADEGHSLLPRARLVAETATLLGDAVDLAALETAVDALAEQEEVVLDLSEDGEEQRVYLPHLFHCEAMLARRLVELLRTGDARALATSEALDATEASAEHALHPDQRAAVLGLLASPVGLLTGGPGVGKTTILRRIVSLAAAAGAEVALASPTGRAAKRLAEATGREAMTVHRLLGYNPSAEERFEQNASNPLTVDLLVVDEISMLDVVLAHHLLKALRAPTRLLLVGDPDQLPSVGPGNVLADLLDSCVVPTFRLTRIFRQEEGSLIVDNAHRLLAGQALQFRAKGEGDADFFFFPAEDVESAAARVLEVVTERIGKTFGYDWTRDVQVIAPMYRGACGVDALNEALREAQGVGGTEITRGSRTWRVGDRVIHTRNDYEREVFNGDMGRIVRADGASGVVVAFPDREVSYTLAELSDLHPAFAITVHRSQGGEFPVVVIPLVTQHAVMLQRNLLYTAITRARELVVLVGSRRALAMAIDNSEQSRRESALDERLRALLDDGEGRSDVALLDD